MLTNPIRYTRTRDEVVEAIRNYIILSRQAKERFEDAITNGAELVIVPYTDLIKNDGIVTIHCCQMELEPGIIEQYQFGCELTIFGLDVFQCEQCSAKYAILTDFGGDDDVEESE